MTHKLMTVATTILIAAALLLGVVATVDAQQREQFATLFVKVLNVTNSATFTGPATFTGDTTIVGATDITGATDIAGNLEATGYFTATDITANNSLTVGNDLVVTDNADVVGNLEVTEYMLTQSWLYMIPPDALTVTDGATITPTASIMELTAAGAVGAELVAAGDGQLLILVNTSANTITISDTATIESTGDIALGQYDTLTLVGMGVKWYEIAASNN